MSATVRMEKRRAEADAGGRVPVILHKDLTGGNSDSHLSR